ncbi:MAG: hypothetical protein GY835_10325, partial [bacterium]|nr:hypothetical protein [bacterium]
VASGVEENPAFCTWLGCSKNECQLHKYQMPNQWQDQLEVKAAEGNGRNHLLEVAQLLVLHDAAPKVSRAVSRRVVLLPDEICAVEVVERAV